MSRFALLLLAMVVIAGTMLPASAYAAACVASDIEPVISTIFTNFLTTLNSTMSTILTSIYNNMGGIALAAANLYVLIYGLQILAGVTQLNTREAVGRLGKVAVVYMLMTGSSIFNMGTVKDFFYSLALEVPFHLFKGSFPNAGGLTLTGEGTNLPKMMLSSLDAGFAGFLCGDLNIALDFKIIGFIGSLFLVHPPLFLIAVGWIWQAFMLLVRAVVGILMSLTAITFLATIGPIFVGFLLFQPTAHLFESWLRHLASYALQVVFTLAALVMWVHLLQAYKTPIKDFNLLINSYNSIHSEAAANANPEKSWSLCEPVVNPTATGPTIKPKNGPGTCNPVPITALLLNPQFMYFYGYYLIALLALTHGFSGLLSSAPGIAQQIANGAGSPGGSLTGLGLDAFSRNQWMDNKSKPQKSGQGLADDEPGAGSRKGSVNYVDMTRDMIGRRKN